jgi:fructokinase
MIVVAGEALIDLAPTVDGAAFVAHVGGGPFNTAIALGRLGTPIAYLGRLSTDGFGRLLRHRLVDGDVDLRFAVDTAEPTTLALVTLSDSGEASYSFYTDGTAGTGLRSDQLPDRLPDDVEAIHLGSLGIVLEPGAAGLEALVERERDRRLISLDPNVRPAIIPDMEAYRRRLERLVARVDLVRLSTDDVALLGDLTPAALAERWLGAGVALVVVTGGGEGAAGYRSSGKVSVPAEPVTVVDTIGAGDSFNAGLLSWLRRHRSLDRTAVEALTADDLVDALRFASRVAAVTCGRPGADPPRWAEVGEA